jgi:hypothetical protein
MTSERIADRQTDILEQKLRSQGWEREDIRRARKVFEALWGAPRLSRVVTALSAVLDPTEVSEIFRALQTARTPEGLTIALKARAWPGTKIGAAFGAICAPDEVLNHLPSEDGCSISKELQDLMNKIEDEDRRGVSDAKRLTRTQALEMWKWVAQHPEHPEAIAWAVFTAKRVVDADNYPPNKRAGQIVRATGLAGNKDRNYAKRRALELADEEAATLESFVDLDAAIQPSRTGRWNSRAALKEIAKLPEFKGTKSVRSLVHKLRKSSRY